MYRYLRYFSGSLDKAKSLAEDLRPFPSRNGDSGVEPAVLCELAPFGGAFTKIAPRFSEAFAEGRVATVVSADRRTDMPPLPDNAFPVFVDPDLSGQFKIPLDSGSVDVILLLDILQSISDYRSVCAEAHRVIRVGGFAFFRVPHQFLYERRFALGSRFDVRNKRFYTPASLALEFEEAIDPFEYRLRALADNDEDFDYLAGLAEPPRGPASVEMLVEKIEPPAWKQEALAFGDRQIDERRPSEEFGSRSGPAPVVAVRAQEDKIKSILLLKLDHRGDFLLARSAFARLRGGFPSAKITFLCGSWNVSEAKASGFFDEVIPFSIFNEQANANRPEMFHEEGLRLQSILLGRHFDLAIDLRLNDDTRFLLDLVYAKYRAGFASDRVRKGLDVVLPYSSSTDLERPFRGYFECQAFCANVGDHRGLFVELREPAPVKPGDVLIYGPYRRLEVGAIQINLHVDSSEGQSIGFDVCYNTGANRIAAGVVRSDGGRASFSVHVDESHDDFEIRLIAVEPLLKPFKFYGASYVKQGRITGPHQSELMALLATLIEERLKYPRSLEILAP
jgi:hypothetical protein